jgi:hypothetical protein
MTSPNKLQLAASEAVHDSTAATTKARTLPKKTIDTIPKGLNKTPPKSKPGDK